MKRKKETEEKIMKAAVGLFVRKGFHGTTIDDVMLKVGMTKGAFYSHFTGKGDLFIRLVERYRTRFFGEIAAKVNDSEGNALEKIYRTFRLLARFAVEDTDLCAFLTFLTTEMNSHRDFEPALSSVYMDCQKLISGLIKQGIRQGVFRKDLSPDLAALTFTALHDGTLLQLALNRQYIDGEEYVRTFIEIFVCGLVSHDPEKKM